jgi:hypothetical protein
MDAPIFEIEMTGEPPRELVICTYMGETGAARVFSAGLVEAKGRAEKQAREKFGQRPKT